MTATTTADAPRVPQSESRPWRMVLRAISSFGVATVVLVFLCIITWLGTLAQVEHGLFEAQKRYFESFFLLHEVAVPNPFSKVGGSTLPVLIPLPGGYLLMIVLFLNMSAGFVLRIRRDWSRVGMYIVHASILFLLIGSWVSFQYKTEGNMQLYESQSSNVYKSYTDWAIEVAEVGGTSVHIIPDSEFAHLEGDEERTFGSEALPFDLRVSHYARNAEVARVGEGAGETAEATADGFSLRNVELEEQAEANVTGVLVRAEGDGVTGGKEGLLWGLARQPHTVTVGDKQYTVKMTRRTWAVPFTVRLDKFNRVLHPNTGIAKEFSSEITKFEDGSERQIKIEMNEPLRHHGYTFFQASWGPETARPGEPLYSVFAVVNNPADKWPLIFVFTVTLGLVVHFILKLSRFLSRSGAKAKPKTATA